MKGNNSQRAGDLLEIGNKSISTKVPTYWHNERVILGVGSMKELSNPLIENAGIPSAQQNS